MENNNFQTYLYHSLPDQLSSSNYTSCKYYTDDDVNNLIKKKVPHMSILHHNIRSINKNFSQLIGLLLNIDIDCDIIALSEIGQINCENIDNLLKSTHKFDSVIPNQTFGGVRIFVKNHLVMDERKDLQIVNENINVENIWYEVNNLLTHESFIVTVIYRHPIYTKMAHDTFNKDLERSVDILSKENKRCIICGDININGLKIGKDDNVASFLNMMLSNNYITHITLLNHIRDHSISLIDHIFIKESDKICNTYIITSLITYLTLCFKTCKIEIAIGMNKCP